MQFESWTQFFAMGGYGFFVWLSFGLSALVILLAIGLSRYNRQSILKIIVQEKQRKQRIAQAKNNQVKPAETEVEKRS
ncbi:heme exporter protein CcmD [Neptunicella sp. SCSIO 80796]|uniref:heme exporter protein CcmD n=1 Tax=Neptunicella plasticusilytica TaxID=3117012 RepID=UPI003A4DD1B4